MTMPDIDKYWMRIALKLAKQGFTTPNPMVGCVIVNQGELAGQGCHPAAGQPHAEVFALRQAGEKARGATVYVTLEPCCHYGRTPPCTDALLAAKAARVVIASRDADPRVKNRGIEILQAAGIEVTTGVLEEEALWLNRDFFAWHNSGRPYLTLKTAMTLDGKTATRTGDSKWITSSSARKQVHQMRARSGAVMTGIGTLLADNSRLDARLTGVALPRQPLRIVVDSRLRTPLRSAAVALANKNPDTHPLLIATTCSASFEKEQALARPGIEILRLPAEEDGRVCLPALLNELASRKIISVLAECGSRLNASLIQQQLVQEALVFIAPKIAGGENAPSPVGGEGVEKMAQAWQLQNLHVKRFGPDIALSGQLK